MLNREDIEAEVQMYFDKVYGPCISEPDEESVDQKNQLTAALYAGMVILTKKLMDDPRIEVPADLELIRDLSMESNRRCRDADDEEEDFSDFSLN